MTKRKKMTVGEAKERLAAAGYSVILNGRGKYNIRKRGQGTLARFNATKSGVLAFAERHGADPTEAETFKTGDAVTFYQVRNLRVCDEREILAFVSMDGVEIQVLGIGVTRDTQGNEHAAYMYLKDAFTIPFACFEWRNNSTALDGDK